MNAAQTSLDERTAHFATDKLHLILFLARGQKTNSKLWCRFFWFGFNYGMQISFESEIQKSTHLPLRDVCERDLQKIRPKGLSPEDEPPKMNELSICEDNWDYGVVTCCVGVYCLRY